MDRIHIGVITIDSLRYDVAMGAQLPNFKALFQEGGEDNWHLVGAHGTYTLPAHISMFTNGYFPNRNLPEVPGPYNDTKERIFRCTLEAHPSANILHPTDSSFPNIVKGFEGRGYTTVGIGGVGWFRPDRPASVIWGKDYFRHFHWGEAFLPMDDKSFENQLGVCGWILGRRGFHPKYSIFPYSGKGWPEDVPLFFFLNVASTHHPYRNQGISPEGQMRSLEYVDHHLPRLIEMLPRPMDLVICADHGDCFGEDGFWGHAIYHPKVMEVPMVYLKLR